MDGNLICAAVDIQDGLIPDLLTTGVRPPERDVLGLLNEAARVLSDSDFVDRPPQHGPLVLTLRKITIREVARSSANTRLYGSVYLDILDDPYLVARDLVHEATHCWLNDLLVALHVRLDSTTDRFWSPWKGQRRPEFGFVHAIASFSSVVVFLDGAAETLPAESRERGRLRILADAERERLVRCRDDVSAIDWPSELADLLVPMYERATLVG